MDTLRYFLIWMLPRKLFSFIVGRMCSLKLPRPICRALIRGFVAYYRVDLAEVEGDYGDFSSFSQFFVRSLKPGARPLEQGILSPADGMVEECGIIAGDNLLQAKGVHYSISDLIGAHRRAVNFADGYFATIYLSPRDYHRVHSPVAGRVMGYVYCPGDLWPVNRVCVERREALYVRNERVCIFLESEWGALAVVMIGALNVGSIRLAFDSLIANEHPFSAESKPCVVEYSETRPIAAGDLLGAFHLGSTVVMLVQKGACLPGPNFRRGPVRYGLSLFELDDSTRNRRG